MLCIVLYWLHPVLQYLGEGVGGSVPQSFFRNDTVINVWTGGTIIIFRQTHRLSIRQIGTVQIPAFCKLEVAIWQLPMSMNSLDPRKRPDSRRNTYHNRYHVPIV